MYKTNALQIVSLLNSVGMCSVHIIRVIYKILDFRTLPVTLIS